ncbi:MAG: hypothetical protein A3K76_03785 [Euryarchaeota archaeon RBG_13_57_23]|nr:MAG: hypothetical protein A3K76_03785 [Euryarchaeota archaeon RBG_13_57_23]
MADDKELLAEIERLREDVKQLREIVNVLVNVVMEEDFEEEDPEFPANTHGLETSLRLNN